MRFMIGKWLRGHFHDRIKLSVVPEENPMCSVLAPKLGQFAERRRQSGAFTGAMVGMVFLVTTSIMRGDSDKEPLAARVAALIEQLGNDQFAKREAASKELAAIGEPALEFLRQAAATNQVPEIRWRVDRAIGVIRASAGQRELAKWAGFWKSPAGDWMEIKGGRWSSGTPTSETYSGIIQIVEIGNTMIGADMIVEQGPTKGQIVRAVFRFDGDSLHYCGTYSANRATDFKTAGDYYSCAFKRSKN